MKIGIVFSNYFVECNILCFVGSLINSYFFEWIFNKQVIVLIILVLL